MARSSTCSSSRTVALPGPPDERPERLTLDAEAAGAELGVQPLDQVIDQQRDVTASVAERRHRQVHDVEPVEEILAEVARLDLVREIAVRAGDDPRVHLHRPCAAHRQDVRVSMTRSSLTWSGSGSSPISSRNREPRLAATKSPGLACTAVVKAPRTCPKSWLSSSASGIAPQLIATKA